MICLGGGGCLGDWFGRFVGGFVWGLFGLLFFLGGGGAVSVGNVGSICWGGRVR